MEPENYVLERVDGLIANYQYSHEESVPIGIKMNSENAVELKDSIKRLNKLTQGSEITHLRGTEILIDDSLRHDEFIIVEKQMNQ